MPHRYEQVCVRRVKFIIDVAVVLVYLITDTVSCENAIFLFLLLILVQR